MKVVFQGEPGANSHMAAVAIYPNAATMPCASFEECFAAVEARDADLAMIPIDNSLAGRVADIHYLLPRSELSIIGEYFMPISFHLMALPGATTAGLKTVESHVHAIGQCRNIIRELGVRPVISGDTAGAARIVSESADLTRSALAPRLAAELYGLKILAENVEDSASNTTRFIILSRSVRIPEPSDGPVVTSFLFKVRNIPAALYKALGSFATNGINMTKLESYQVDGKFFATQFYADVESHPDDPALRLTLDELRYFSTDLRIVGVYPASPQRTTLRVNGGDASSG